MLSLSKIDLDAMNMLRPYLQRQPYRTSDYAPGAIFQWRAYIQSAYAVCYGMLIMTLQDEDGSHGYMAPLGDGDMEGALIAIEQDASDRGIPLRYCAVPEGALPVLEARYGARLHKQALRQWADYLYEWNDLVSFPGKKYHTQRNHFNRFKKENPSYRLVPVTAETQLAAERFLDEYEHYYASIDKPIEAEEMLRARELLHDAQLLMQKATYLEVDGAIIALAIGEVVGDTLYVHVEKARTDYAGAYQAIVSLFAEYAAEPGTRYINREDDSGDDGLRYSKLEYRPICLLDKYWITVDAE